MPSAEAGAFPWMVRFAMSDGSLVAVTGLPLAESTKMTPFGIRLLALKATVPW